MPSWFQKVLAASALLLAAPVLLLAAVAIVLESGFPIFFRQQRVGRFGRPFQILKFRSMRIGVAGHEITGSNDRRITRVGRWIRRYKVDELPQLWNILRGDMHLVGPRPEVPRYVALNDSRWRAVLAVKPGLADLATLVYRDEEAQLGQAASPDQLYREVILPEKLALSQQYLGARSWHLDCKILMRTVLASFLPSLGQSERMRRSFPSGAPK